MTAGGRIGSPGGPRGGREDAPPRIDVCVPAHLGAPGAARRGVSALAPAGGDPLMADVLLIVSELVTNAVRHGGLGAGDWIRVRVTLTADGARLEVCDPGTGFDPPPPRPCAPEEPGGRGLWLVDQLARRWGVERGRRTRVWCELERR